MSKHILVISASPRKGGNSDAPRDKFICGVQESGNQAEEIFLASRKIGYCTGYSVCNTTRKCAQENEMAEILDRMVDTNIIVLATLVYFYTMDAQMKTLIDRTVPRYTEIQNKDFYFIVAATDTGQKIMDRTIEGFRRFTRDCLAGAREKGIIYGADAWQAGEIKGTPAMEQAYGMGRNVQLKYKMHDGPEGMSYVFFQITAIAGNECKKGLTRECVDVNAAGESIVNDFSFRVVQNIYGAEIYVTYSPLLNKSHFVTLTYKR